MKTNKMIKTIFFDGAGELLWVNIILLGPYHISFAYELLEKDLLPTSSPMILTAPIVAGDNLSGRSEFFFPVVNVFQPGEPLSVYDKRYIHTLFFVRKLWDDPGFTIGVQLLQGEDPMTAAIRGTEAIGVEYSNIGDDILTRLLGIRFRIASGNEAKI